MKLRSREDLKKLRSSAAKDAPDAGNKKAIMICGGGGCIASGALEVKEAIEAGLAERDLEKKVAVVETGCMGPCVKGPVILMVPDRTFYQNVTPEDVSDIIDMHIRKGETVERLVWNDEHTGQPVPLQGDLEFFKRQKKVVLRNCGIIDPEKIDDYISRNGYEALAAALESKREDIIGKMKESGLRGRGGAGFPTYMKWKFTMQAEGDEKYVLCNADEGDPGAFMDRSVLEGDPHSLIEGMAIAAYTVGARKGYVYVRAEYPLAVERLGHGIEKAREYGLLGKNILGSSFSFDLEIRMGSGAFVCGEETALIHSIEGKRGEPRPRPPFPAQKGVWDKPSVLNNVETYANIAPIMLEGADWYSKLGTEHSGGTKIFALAGSVKNTGLVEVPIGTTLGELIYDIGGGILNNKPFKAAQIGGPSGGCVPKEHLNVTLDYESLKELGAIMGSGGLIVMDEDTCMVDVARFFLEFVQEESCGKCTPCRVGTLRMLEILNKIVEGKGEMEDLDKLEELGKQIQDTALCGLGQTAPNPVLSTLIHFRQEYIDHIQKRHCEAGTCPGLVRASCQSACPANVDVPGYVSLIGEKRYAEALRLHRERNPFAGVCARVCFHTCEDKCARSTIDDSVSIRGLKRFMVEQEITIQTPEVRENEERQKKKVAVIGAGPAGLSCAYFLARMGYRPVVFESQSRPGGMLVQTIPAYRLPRETLAREIRMIEQLGVEIQPDMQMGKDFTLDSLKQDGFEAVFVGIGTSKGITLNLEGKDADGVDESISFLKEYNIRGSVKVGKDVIIIGGGNAAVDAARTAVRLGAERVRVVYRRTREQMPAYKEEIEDAVAEGVELKILTSPVAIETKNGKAVGLRCEAMTLGEFDKSGRRRPKAGEGDEFVLDADQIIFACGQEMDSESFSGHDKQNVETGE